MITDKVLESGRQVRQGSKEGRRGKKEREKVRMEYYRVLGDKREGIRTTDQDEDENENEQNEQNEQNDLQKATAQLPTKAIELCWTLRVSNDARWPTQRRWRIEWIRNGSIGKSESQIGNW